MYVVTFYSYKGGVGRTMALANTAALLAQSGKRVLVVDFDLEAPGLPSYDMFRCAQSRKGIVDYVTAYRQTMIAPTAADYVVECDFKDIKLWLMPAGDYSEPEYTSRLNSVDWEALYASESGYLMFEDLKQQWSQHDGKGFDYVLIDSRTGHTDVGGICTRQLPDAVVIMFVPNRQNVEGLKPIVEGIRLESRERSRKIALHFCPSNVPEEYDEDGILVELLDNAASELGYETGVGADQPAAIVHHRTSLDLLSQPMITLERPKSRLASEYGTLKTAVIAKNNSDRDGALVALMRIPEDLEAAREEKRARNLTIVGEAVASIRREHPEDGEIAYRAARALNIVGDLEGEVAALDIAVRARYRTISAKMARAYALSKMVRSEDALADLRDVLTSPEATPFEIRPSAQLLRFVDRNSWRDAAVTFYRTPGATVIARTLLATYMMTDRDLLTEIAFDMTALAGDPGVTMGQRDAARNLATLALIGSGRFKEAMEAITPDRASLFGMTSPVNPFNYTIAQWGLEGLPPTDLAEHLLTTKPDESTMDANAHQCFALVYSILGDQAAARTQIEAALHGTNYGSVAFSCWRFLYVTPEDFAADMSEMRVGLEDGVLTPPFLQSVPRALH